MPGGQSVIFHLTMSEFSVKGKNFGQYMVYYIGNTAVA